MTEEKTDTAPQGDAPAPGKPKKTGGGVVDGLWKTLSSVHLAVILLLILAAISIIGTVLQQGDATQDNIQLFENMLSRFTGEDADQDRLRSAAERLTRFSEKVGFTNLYHTWYFYFLLALFTLNLLVCSVKRLPHTWKLMTKNPVAQEERRLKSMANRRSLTLGLSRDEAAAKVGDALKKAGYKPKSVEEGGALHFFAQKGVYSRLGVYSTHLSIIVILLGGIVGVTSGFKGYMQIVEGTSESSFWDRRAKKMRKFDFEVRCDNFQVDFYEGSRQPKDYYSDLTVLKDGVEIKSKRIEVNSPITYDPNGSKLAENPAVGWLIPKIYFYQSSYGETGQGMKARFRLTDGASGETAEESLGRWPGEFSALGTKVKVIQIVPDFAVDQNQQPYSKSNQPSNPAALVEVTGDDGQSRRAWLFRNWPDVKMGGELPVNVVFADFGGVQYTGLQVVYDPGVWLIWLGCIVMVIGLYLAFFVSHRRIWARVAEGEGGSSVFLAGSANKNRDAYAEEFKGIGDGLEGEGA